MVRIDYDAGGRNKGQLYTNLMKALKYEGEGINRRKREDIENEGIFGTGIKRSHIEDLTNTGMSFAKFGAGRKDSKKASARESFKARMDESKARINELRRFGDRDSINEIRFIQAGMAEERNKFENLMMDYDEKSLWDTGFGGEGVGYRGTGEMSTLAKKYMKSKSDKDRRRRMLLADEDRRQQHQTSDSSAFSDWRESKLPPMDEISKYREEPRKGQPDTFGQPIEVSDKFRTMRNYIEDDHPVGQGEQWDYSGTGKGPQRRDQYFPGSDSPDGLYRPKPYSRSEDSFSDGLMRIDPKDYYGYDEWSNSGGYWGG
jgi:hypothetical protein